jgi:hypothetical protein
VRENVKRVRLARVLCAALDEEAGDRPRRRD